MAAIPLECKDERQPLNSQNVVHYVDITPNGDHGNDHRTLRSDPLVLQLPKAMLQYVRTPDQHQGKLVFVNRGVIYALCHSIMSVFCVLCCFYSCCRMKVVRKGEIALTQYSDQPEILGQGRHVLLSPWNRFVAIKRLTEPIIKHGPIHIIRVQSGQLGYGIDMKSGHPILLTQGEHILESNTFQWIKFITLREPQTRLANLTIIRVETGYVGYCYKQGQLVILKPGLHLIQPPDRFGKIITTQMTILDLPCATHETSDYVPLAIKAAVFYRIIDPLKALVRIQNIPKQIQETSTATLAGIIRGSSLADVASRSTPFYHPKQTKEMKRTYMRDKKEEKQDQDQSFEDLHPTQDLYAGITRPKSIPIAPYAPHPSAPPYFQHVHDEFMQQLHDHVRDEWGIEIQNIRIESLKIADAKLQSNISSQAIQVSNTHNKFMLLMKQQEIVTVQAETDARKIQIDTDAEASRIRTRAQAKADAIVIEAEANKKAKELQGQGESEYSRLLQSTKLGTQLASMKLQADAITGLKQIAYVPHLPGILNRAGVFAGKDMIMPDQNDEQ